MPAFMQPWPSSDPPADLQISPWKPGSSDPLLSVAGRAKRSTFRSGSFLERAHFHAVVIRRRHRRAARVIRGQTSGSPRLRSWRTSIASMSALSFKATQIAPACLPRQRMPQTSG